MKYIEARLTQRVIVIFLAAFCELTGRYLFPNWDINYLLYGARFYMDNQAPWMDVWTGIDTLNGIIAIRTGSPELAITTIGLILAITATLIIDEIFVQLKFSTQARITAVLGTALFFKPTLGGWVSDHLSYLIGLAPGFTFIFKKFRLTKLVAISIGFSLSLGLTLKLNSFVTSYVFTLIWIGLYLLIIWQKERIPIKKVKLMQYIGYSLASAFLTCIFVTWVVGLGGNLYFDILSTYKLASESTAGSQFSVLRGFKLPLQINFIEAIKNKSLGVIIFFPFVILFWISLGRSLSKLLKPTNKIELKQHWIALFLIVSTSIVCFSLGRGLSHRLFLLPAGIILSLEGIKFSKLFYKGFLFLMATYFTFTWLGLAWAQRDLEKNRPYNTRVYLNQNSQIQQLCLKDIDDSESINYAQFAKLGILPIKFIGAQINNFVSKCWNSKEASEQIAGLMHVQEPANALGISFRNDKAGQGDYFEKWNAHKRELVYRKAWTKEKANWINSNQYPYFIERIRILPEEISVPGYIENRIPREHQLEELVNLTDAQLIGSIGNVMLWETKWARKP